MDRKPLRRFLVRRLVTTAEILDLEAEAPLRDVADQWVRRARDLFPGVTAIASELRDLLATKDRKSAQRLARTISLPDEQLVALIANAGELGYAHERVNREDRPAHLKLTDEETHAYFYGRATAPDLAAKAQSKILAMFRERRVLTGHIFWNDERWHAFTFTYDDAWMGRRGHWKEGPHLHYTSDLFEPGRKAKDVLAELVRPDSKVHGEHIRFPTEGHWPR